MSDLPKYNHSPLADITIDVATPEDMARKLEWLERVCGYSWPHDNFISLDEHPIS